MVAQRRRAQRCSGRHRSGEAVEEEEMGCSIYSRQRRWNEGGAAVEPWVGNSGGGHSWDVVGAV
jgi:hypothetical protein